MKTRYLASVTTGMLFAICGLFNTANASLMTLTFDNGDSLADWSTDRATPADFNIINNELVMSVGGALNSDNFRNTQGMMLDIGKSDYMSIDMWVDSAWNVAGRFGGFWGVAYKADGTRADEYPILEFQNNYDAGAGAQTGIAKWDSNIGWVVPPSSLFTSDAWNKLEIMLSDNMYQYFVNGNLVHTAVSTSAYLGKVILNGYNSMPEDSQLQGYNVRYDNLTYGTVPEPSSLAIFALSLLGLGARRLRKN